MANYTLKVEAVCAGGEHITLQLYKDGVAKKKITLNKSEIADADTDVSDVIIFLAKLAAKSAGATTPAQRKAAIEGMVISL